MNGPLARILAAFDSGARSVPEISRTTGLNRDLVDAGIDHLVATGRLIAEPLASGCPEGACDGCALLPMGCGGRHPLPSRARSLRLARLSS